MTPQESLHLKAPCSCVVHTSALNWVAGEELNSSYQNKNFWCRIWFLDDGNS